MTRLFTWALIGATVIGSLVAASAPAGADRDPVRSIARELRCPVCEGLSVADSSSPTAQNMRADIARRLDEGESRGAIIQAYVARYGDWIRLRPRASGIALFAWGGPAAALAAATIALGAAFVRWRTPSTTTVNVADIEAVQSARAAWRAGREA